VKKLALTVAAAISAAFILGASPMSGPVQLRPNSYAPTLAIPDTIYATPGHEVNVWGESLSPVPSGATGAAYSYVSTLGRVTTRGWRFRPGATTSAPLTITALDANGTALTSATTRIVAVSDSAGTGSANVLFIGDSVLASGGVVGQVDTLFTAGGGGTIALQGSQGSGKILHEGRIGYEIRDFATAGDAGHRNPFAYADTLNLQQYIADSTLAAPDYAVIHLGGNDIFSTVGAHVMTSTELDSLLYYMDVLLEGITSADDGYPDCKVIISLIGPWASDPSAFGYVYGAIAQRRYFDQNTAAFNRAVVARYDGGAHLANVDVCASNLFIDRINGYASAQDSVSARCAVQVPWYNNYLHPKVQGNRQMADAMYAHLRGLRNQEVVQANNLLPNSTDFTTWTATGAPTQGSNTTDPLGGSNAQTWTAATNTYTRFDKAPGAAGWSGTMEANTVISCYMKYISGGESGAARVAVSARSAAATATWYVEFAIGAGSCLYASSNVAAGSTLQYGIDTIGGGWYRVWMWCNATADAGEAAYARIWLAYPNTHDSAVVSPWGAQFETGVTTPGAYDATP